MGLRTRVKNSLKRRIGRALGSSESERPATAPYAPRAHDRVDVRERDYVNSAPEPAEAVAEPAPEEVSEAPPAASALPEDSAGRPLTPDQVEIVLDEMVRPALNADGGDIALVRVDGDDVFVKLVGACSTCPSSIVTMKQGVERLLQEEFPSMRRLIDVDEAGLLAR